MLAGIGRNSAVLVGRLDLACIQFKLISIRRFGVRDNDCSSWGAFISRRADLAPKRMKKHVEGL